MQAADHSPRVKRPCWHWLLILALLATPSIWLCATVPPLWRDADAYFQLTDHPARSTYLGHGALYCLVVRVPLRLGYQLEYLKGEQPKRPKHFLANPRLTDTGTLLLIAAQHIALCLAALALITAATRVFVVRLLLAFLFALTPIFYTFAHCVSSETLSMILLLLVAAVALRLIKNYGARPTRDWCLLGLALCAAILTRPANILVALLLPLAFLIPGVARHWRRALLALLIAIVSIAAARLTTAAICHAGGYPTYTRFGFPFLWRLSFLDRQPIPVRNELLDRAESKLHTDDARRLLGLIHQTVNDSGKLEASDLLRRSYDSFLDVSENNGYARRWDLALNEIAHAFLYPPPRELLKAACDDFRAATGTSLGAPTFFLFVTTVYYFDHADSLSQYARLHTYRDFDRNALLQIATTHPYLHSLGKLKLNFAIVLWFVLTAVTLLRVRNSEVRAICIYTAVLIAGGLLIMASTCLIGEMLPRYTLPGWETTIVAIILVLGQLGDALRISESPPGGSLSQVKLPGGPSPLPPETR